MLSQRFERDRIGKRDATIAVVCHPMWMKPEMAASHVIHEGPVVDISVVSIQRKPFASLGMIQRVQYDVSDV
ncbi:hypothetical protein K788_0002321 [Paraburkholderia caribensis MBA4]|uniref:Uncharacterized protein n=1 Tax=Paraburkholderia caribensis MBA4 TaxID=1323664 RepID=A0A0P0R977_9BURK|nr:hypothetical protein K788_0002321 [Paraburkholderia caribensis MBA4]